MRHNDYFGAVGPMQLGAPNSGLFVLWPSEIFQTPLLDFTQPVSSIELIPARQGHFPLISQARFLIEALAGTQVTPPTIRAGSDVGHVNFWAQSSITPSNTVFNTPAVPPALGGAPSQPASSVPRISNAAVFFDIVTGGSGTGGYALKGKLSVAVFWIALG